MFVLEPALYWARRSSFLPLAGERALSVVSVIKSKLNFYIQELVENYIQNCILFHLLLYGATYTETRFGQANTLENTGMRFTFDDLFDVTLL